MSTVARVRPIVLERALPSRGLLPRGARSVEQVGLGRERIARASAETYEAARERLMGELDQAISRFAEKVEEVWDGDIELDTWKALVEKPEFKELVGTEVLPGVLECIEKVYQAEDGKIQKMSWTGGARDLEDASLKVMQLGAAYIKRFQDDGLDGDHFQEVAPDHLTTIGDSVMYIATSIAAEREMID